MLGFGDNISIFIRRVAALAAYLPNEDDDKLVMIKMMTMIVKI